MNLSDKKQITILSEIYQTVTRARTQLVIVCDRQTFHFLKELVGTEIVEQFTTKDVFYYSIILINICRCDLEK